MTVLHVVHVLMNARLKLSAKATSTKLIPNSVPIAVPVLTYARLKQFTLNKHQHL